MPSAESSANSRIEQNPMLRRACPDGELFPRPTTDASVSGHTFFSPRPSSRILRRRPRNGGVPWAAVRADDQWNFGCRPEAREACMAQESPPEIKAWLSSHARFCVAWRRLGQRDWLADRHTHSIAAFRQRLPRPALPFDVASEGHAPLFTYDQGCVSRKSMTTSSELRTSSQQRCRPGILSSAIKFHIPGLHMISFPCGGARKLARQHHMQLVMWRQNQRFCSMQG